MTVHFINRDGEKISVKASPGDTLLDVVINEDLDFDGFGTRTRRLRPSAHLGRYVIRLCCRGVRRNSGVLHVSPDLQRGGVQEARAGHGRGDGHAGFSVRPD